MQFHKVIISFGANLPDNKGREPHKTIPLAMQELDCAQLQLVAGSSLWSSPAWPDANDPVFCNTIGLYMCALTPLRLMNRLMRKEVEFGRIRSRRNAPRCMDIDIIDFDGLQKNTGRLKLPHPAMSSRAFVLLPLQEVEPGWIHPGTALSIDDLIAKIPVAEVANCKNTGQVQN